MTRSITKQYLLYRNSEDFDRLLPKLQKISENEKWLEDELDKIDPNRHEMGSAGETGALRKLVFSLKERIDGGSK